MWSSAARMTSEFSYVQSCDLEANVQIKICTMEGSLPPLELEELLQNQLLQFCGRKQSKVPDFMIEAVVLGKCVWHIDTKILAVCLSANGFFKVKLDSFTFKYFLAQFICFFSGITEISASDKYLWQKFLCCQKNSR